MVDRGKDQLPSGIEIGAAVTVHTTANPGQKGIVKYWGPIVGATGSWLGVELDTPTGKNSGSSGGQPYFECKPNHGVFLKPNQVKLLEVTEEESKRKIKPKPPGSMIGSGISKLPQKKKPEEDVKPEDQPSLDEEEKKDLGRKEKLRQEARQRVEQRKQEMFQKVSEKRNLASERASLALEETSEDVPDPQTVGNSSRINSSLREKDDTIEQLKLELSKCKEDFEEAKLVSEADLKRLQQSWEATESSLREQISSLELKLKAKPKAVGEESDLQDMIETLTLDKEIAESNVETLERENEELKEQVTELKDEIELRNLELEQIQSEGGAGDVGSAELKLAFKKLYSETELKRIQYEDRIVALEQELSSIPGLQSKANQVSSIRAELEDKELKIAELQEALDEASAYGSMVEKMTEQNLKQGERIKELESQLEEIQEVREIETQIAEDQAELEKYLNDEIHNKDVDILELKRALERKDEDIADLERVINQFRQKVVQLSNEGSGMRDQLERSGEVEKLKKMQELNEKIIQLQSKARELRGQGLNAKIAELQKEQFQSQISSLLAVFPPGLLDSLEFQGLQNLSMLRLTMKKALLLVSELLDRISDYQSQPYLLAWVFDICSYCINYVSIARELERGLQGMPPVKYHSISRATDWGQVQALSRSLDFIFRLLRDENLTASTPLDSLKLSIEAISKFKDLNVQETAIQLEVGRLIYIAVVGVAVAYNTHGLNRSFSGSVEVQEILTRMTGASMRLLSSNYQWDLDSALAELKTILVMKLQTLTQLLFGEKKNVADTFEWHEWIAGIDRDIKGVTITTAYKSLTDEESQTVPWKLLILDTQHNLEQFQNTLSELTASKALAKDLSLKIVIFEKEISELRITKSNLESRLGDAHVKAQRLAQLEIETKRLLEKDKHVEESIQALKTANEKLTNRNRDLEDEMKKFQEEDQDQVSNFLLKSSSMLASGGLVNVNRGSGLIHSTPRFQSGGEDLEVYKTIIDVLQAEKVRLSSEYILSKLRGSYEDYVFPEPNPASETLGKLRGIRSSLHRKIASTRILDLSRPDFRLIHAAQKEDVARLEKQAKTLVTDLASSCSTEASSFSNSVGSSFANELTKQTKVKLGLLKMGGNAQKPVEIMVSLKELRSVHEVFNLV